MTEPIHIISLGAGVQSSTMALMAAAGEITPMPKFAIFADTQAEPKSVYTWLDWLEKQLPFPVIRVTHGSLEKDTLHERLRKDGKGTWVPGGIPHYSINADGSKGHGPRQCTHDFKLLPIISKQREIIGKPAMLEWRRRHKDALSVLSKWEKELSEWKRRKKRGHQVGPSPMKPLPEWAECQSDPLAIIWIGISSDEASRVKESRHAWMKNIHPLFYLEMSRAQCLVWMQKRGFPKPPRSACVFCPYHRDVEWRRLRDEEPEEFARAIRFDVAYRNAKVRTVKVKGFVPFLHDSRRPLSEVNFDLPSHDQVNLFNNDCEGMCGV